MSYKKHTWDDGEVLTVTSFSDIDKFIVADEPITTVWEAAKPKRIRCEYCDCLSEKDYGTCEHCGAAL